MCTCRLFPSPLSPSVSACLYLQCSAVPHRLGVPSPRGECGRSHSRNGRQREACQEAFGGWRSRIGAKVPALSLPAYNNMRSVWTKIALVHSTRMPLYNPCCIWTASVLVKDCPSTFFFFKDWAVSERCKSST